MRAPRLRLAWLLVPIILLGAPAATLGRQASTTPAAGAAATPFICRYTVPNGSTPPFEEPNPGYHGNGVLWTGLPLDGITLVLPDGMAQDGTLHVSWGWWRGDRGRLTVEGRRLDEPAPPLQSRIFPGYEQFYFQDTELIFPTGGCWQVTGRDGGASLTFVTLVLRSPVGIAPAEATPAATP